MKVKIVIEDVPEEVRDELAYRAALQDLTMQEFLLRELSRLASRLSAKAWVQEVRDQKKESGINVPISVILAARDADRK